MAEPITDGKALYGNCPFMSGPGPMPVKTKVIKEPNAREIAIGILTAPCMGPQCHLWHETAASCALRVQADLATNTNGS
jgi:hypothetical protein